MKMLFDMFGSECVKIGHDHFLPHPFQYVIHKFPHSNYIENTENQAARMNMDYDKLWKVISFFECLRNI
jgi:hypothetical protein